MSYSSDFIARLPKEKESRKYFTNAFDCETKGFNGNETIVSYALETGETGVLPSFQEFCELLVKNITNPSFVNARWYAHNLGFDMIRLYNTLYRFFVEPSELAYANEVENRRMQGNIVEPAEKPYFLSCTESGDGNIISVAVSRNITVEPSKRSKRTESYTKRDDLFVFLDSTAIFGKKPLESLAKAFGYKKLVGSIDFEGGEIPDINNPQHVKYALEDSVILRDVMIDFDKEVYDQFGVHLKYTAASTALSAWYRTIPTYSVMEKDKKGNEVLKEKSHIYSRLSESVEKFARLCYTGGFVHVGKDAMKNHKNAVYSDANSMYPFVMRLYGVPKGKPVKTCSYEDGDIGLYCGRVYGLSDDKVNCVLTVSDKALIAPHCLDGEGFYTYLTSVDIENIYESGGYFEVDYGYRFKQMEFPFKEFIDRCEYLRMHHAKTIKEEVAKLMQNSLYGKFGMKPDGREYLIDKSSKYEFYYQEGYARSFEVMGESTDESDDSIEMNYDDFKQISESLDEGLVRYVKSSPRSAPYMLPHWAAFVTSNARMHLHRMVRAGGYNETLYTDTDSVVLSEKGWNNALNTEFGKQYIWNPESGLPKRYGDFKIEHFCDEFRSLGAKMYAYKETRNGDSVFGGASKGAPVKAIKQFGKEKYYNLMIDNKPLPELEYESITSLDGVLCGKPRVIARTRKASKIENSAKFDIIKGRVFPKKIGNDFKHKHLIIHD